MPVIDNLDGEMYTGMETFISCDTLNHSRLLKSKNKVIINCIDDYSGPHTVNVQVKVYGEKSENDFSCINESLGFDIKNLIGEHNFTMCGISSDKAEFDISKYPYILITGTYDSTTDRNCFLDVLVQ